MAYSDAEPSRQVGDHSCDATMDKLVEIAGRIDVR